ncbi:hypothetical protein O6H91_02G088900 [Diphasiastrum complanatum]|uniref:Uncharacterized protein n=1 Tax=Diphasiastrum complanatum TaxID=34168 RepID=A0ACC2EHS8_DIPCM|nr:hypothetical protein O6H91_02G088900 [Diphasiastrum complanatum]
MEICLHSYLNIFCWSVALYREATLVVRPSSLFFIMLVRNSSLFLTALDNRLPPFLNKLELVRLHLSFCAGQNFISLSNCDGQTFISLSYSLSLPLSVNHCSKSLSLSLPKHLLNIPPLARSLFDFSKRNVLFHLIHQKIVYSFSCF